MDMQLEQMAKRAANFLPPSQRNKRPMPVKQPVAGVEIGAEKTAVQAPGQPAVVKDKTYVKPFASAGKPGAPLNRNAAGRMLGRM